MGRNRTEQQNNVIQPQASAPAQDNVIRASNFPAARGNVIAPIVSTSRGTDKVRLVPASGGTGSVMTRDRANKAAKSSNGTLVVREL